MKPRRVEMANREFIMACIFEGLEYIHEMQFIHRDIKPENLVFGADGYLHITDFGVARPYREQNSEDASGTPSYMAPEVLFKRNHTYNSDLYPVGVMLYEIIMGRRPYAGKFRSEIREEMSLEQAKISDFDINHENITFSSQCIDLTNQLLNRDPKERLGYIDGIQEVKKHPWFAGFNWQKLSLKQLPAPFIPSVYTLLI